MTIGHRHTLVLASILGAVCAALLLGAKAHAESATPSKPEADSHFIALVLATMAASVSRLSSAPRSLPIIWAMPAIWRLGRTAHFI
jgi:hypothetical protein